MSTALATQKSIPDAIETALIHGDLKDLNVEGRIAFYNQVCKSLGLNPLTKPFAYINLNGKLTLYALKDCTEQLRKIHGVSIISVDPKQVGDLLVVVASARDREGKVDASTGAVSVSKLSGEALANAMMKAETKAKRRVTLSICGLGLLDETEVQTLQEQGVAKPEQVTAEAKWDKLDPPQPALPSSTTTSGTETSQPTANQSSAAQTEPITLTLDESGRLMTTILDVNEKMTKPGKNGSRPYLQVIWQGQFEGFNSGVCFDSALFDPIKASMSHQCALGVEWKEGQTTPPKITGIIEYEGVGADDDIPF